MEREYLFIKNWFIVQTKPREEERALFHLRQKGIEVYLPRMEVMTFHAGRWNLVHKPLFPSYLFARFIARELLDTVRWTQGVAKILIDSARPIPIKDEIIDRIKGLEGPDGIIRRQKFKKGDKIRIVRGPLKDITGIFQCWRSDRGRVMLLLNLISYQAKIELHYSLVEKIE